MIPEFNESGDLPIGVHLATLEEMLDRLGSLPLRRKQLGQRLSRIFQTALRTGHLARFIVFGSFVTAKSKPNDVDVFMIMEDTFESSELDAETALVFDHMAAERHFGASVFWVRRLAAFGGEQETIEDWQRKREGGRRGYN